MDHLSELQQLTSEACDALKAAMDILADPEPPLFYRVQAHDRCMEAFRKRVEKIPDAANLAIAQETVRISLNESWPGASTVVTGCGGSGESSLPA